MSPIPDLEFEAFYKKRMLQLSAECEEFGVHGLYFAYNMVLVGLTSIKKEIGEIGYKELRDEMESIVYARCKSDSIK